jgi:Glycosyl transferase family 11
MVEVKYMGLFGNRLYEYCLGRIIAETLGYKLKAEPIPGFTSSGQTVDGLDYSDGAVEELAGMKIDLAAVLNNRTPRKILLRGYFQRYEYFQPYKDLIRKKWLVPDLPPPPPHSDREIVLHVRRGDYILQGWATPFEFFQNVIELAGCDRVYIVTDAPKDPFFRRFKKYHPVIVSKSQLEDFAFLRSFKKMVISESTFSWWAAFLSDAETVYMPRTENGIWSGKMEQLGGMDMRVDLEVADETRFKVVPVKGHYRPNLAEFVFNALWYKRRLQHRWKMFANRMAGCPTASDGTPLVPASKVKK